MQDKKIWATLHEYIEPGNIMGRVVANEDFLRALFAANPFDEYHFYLRGQNQIDALKARLDAEFPQLPIVYGLWNNLPEILGKVRFSVFHLSDWVVGYVPLAMLRNRFAKHIFPITGTTHSLSYARYHAEFFKHLWRGCTPRDAIVVTSRAGKMVVAEAFKELRENYKLSKKFAEPRLVQIPLGVPGLPEAAEISAWREAGRAELELGPDEVMLLYLGRISHDSKKDMLALLRVLKRLK